MGTGWALADESLSAEKGAGPKKPAFYFCYTCPKNCLCSRSWEEGPWLPTLLLLVEGDVRGRTPHPHPFQGCFPSRGETRCADTSLVQYR